VEGDLGQPSLESGPPLDRLAALAQVVVDGDDPVARPAQSNSPVSKGVLAGGGFQVLEDLLRGGLADVDNGRAGEGPGVEVARTEGGTQGRPPFGCLLGETGRAGAPAERGVVVGGGRADAPTAAASSGFPGGRSLSGAGGNGACWGSGHVAGSPGGKFLGRLRPQKDQFTSGT